MAFPVELVDGPVHVIVVPPGSTLTESTFDIEEIDSLRGIVET